VFLGPLATLAAKAIRDPLVSSPVSVIYPIPFDPVIVVISSVQSAKAPASMLTSVSGVVGSVGSPSASRNGISTLKRTPFTG